jgi:hypothetical protein
VIGPAPFAEQGREAFCRGGLRTAIGDSRNIGGVRRGGRRYNSKVKGAQLKLAATKSRPLLFSASANGAWFGALSIRLLIWQYMLQILRKGFLRGMRD